MRFVGPDDFSGPLDVHKAERGRKMEAYFDNSATTQVFDCVKDAVVNAMTMDYGNAAARHQKPVAAEKIITEPRRARATSLQVQEKDIQYTS